MSSSRPPPAITVDLSRRPGESVWEHLARIGREHCRLPGQGPARELAPTPTVTGDELTEEDVTAKRIEALQKLRPRKRSKR